MGTIIWLAIIGLLALASGFMAITAKPMKIRVENPSSRIRKKEW